MFGLGGDRLQAEGGRLLGHVRDLAVVGLFEVLRHLRRLRAVFRSVLDEVEREPPAVAVLVDYAEFNLRLARELRKRGVPVVYYVSPQVWAWRRGRLRAIRESVAHMVVIFPFEEPLYREAGVPVTFVGHPLVELARPAADRAAFLASRGLDPARPVLAVLPGSRRQEVAHNLPPIAAALGLLQERRPELQLALAVAPSLDPGLFDGPLAGLPVTRVSAATHELLSASSAGIVASGTATVEAALMDLPMVVVYRLSPLTYALGRPFVQGAPLRDGQPDRRAQGRHGADPGRLPTGEGGRGGGGAPRGTAPTGGLVGARRGARPARPARSLGARGGGRGSADGLAAKIA